MLRREVPIPLNCNGYPIDTLIDFDTVAQYPVGNKLYLVQAEIHRCREHRCNRGKDLDAPRDNRYCMLLRVRMRCKGYRGFHGDYGNQYTVNQYHAVISTHKVLNPEDIVYLTPKASPDIFMQLTPVSRYVHHVLQPQKSQMCNNIQSAALTKQLSEGRCFYCGNKLVEGHDCLCDPVYFLAAQHSGAPPLSQVANRSRRLISDILYFSALELARDGTWYPMGPHLIVAQISVVRAQMCIVLDNRNYALVSREKMDRLKAMTSVPLGPYFSGSLDCVFVRHQNQIQYLPLRNIVSCLHERQAMKKALFRAKGMEYKMKRKLGTERSGVYFSVNYGRVGYVSDYSSSASSSDDENSKVDHPPPGRAQPRFLTVDIPENRFHLLVLGSKEQMKGEEESPVNQEHDLTALHNTLSLYDICNNSIIAAATDSDYCEQHTELTSKQFIQGCRTCLPTSIYEHCVTGASILNEYYNGTFFKLATDILEAPTPVEKFSEEAVRIFSPPTTE